MNTIRKALGLLVLAAFPGTDGGSRFRARRQR